MPTLVANVLLYVGVNAGTALAVAGFVSEYGLLVGGLAYSSYKAKQAKRKAREQQIAILAGIVCFSGILVVWGISSMISESVWLYLTFILNYLYLQKARKSMHFMQSFQSL